MNHLRQGNRGPALDCFRKAIHITPEMTARLIAVLKDQKVEFIVAPHESDAQCAYMSRTGQVSCILSEDSDMLPYGCSRVFFKMDSEGNGEEIKARNLGANEEIDMLNWIPAQFVGMCILAGCDYLESLPGIGLRKAHRLMAEHKTLDRALRHLRLEGLCDDTYVEGAHRALLTFRHQVIYNTEKGERMMLSEMTDDFGISDLSFLGSTAELSKPLQQQVARGQLHPRTFQPFPEEPLADWKPGPGRVTEELPQSNTIDRYLRPVPRQPGLMEFFEIAEKRACAEGQSSEVASAVPLNTKQHKRQRTESTSTSVPFVSRHSSSSAVGRCQQQEAADRSPPLPFGVRGGSDSTPHTKSDVKKVDARSRFFGDHKPSHAKVAALETPQAEPFKYAEVTEETNRKAERSILQPFSRSNNPSITRSSTKEPDRMEGFRYARQGTAISSPFTHGKHYSSLSTHPVRSLRTTRSVDLSTYEYPGAANKAPTFECNLQTRSSSKTKSVDIASFEYSRRKEK